MVRLPYSFSLFSDLQSNFFVDNHSHMLSGDRDNETTLRLLYYPPVIEEDDNKCEMAKGRCKYSQQHCNGNGLDLHLAPPKDSQNGKNSDGEDSDSSTGSKKSQNAVVNGETSDKDDDHHAGDDNVSEKSSDSERKNSTGSAGSTSSDGSTGNVTRCGAHCDYGTFTLLSQDSEGGLEVKLPGTHKWARVGHLPGAILINTGEILSLWSQDRFPALEHRVVIPKQESLRVRGRHSIAFFCHPG